jgi:hypothetical protein
MDTDRDDPMDPQLANAIRGLRDTPPSEDLWPEIVPRLVQRVPRGSVLLRWPTAIAAGLLIALTSVSGTALLLNRRAVVVRGDDPVTTAIPSPVIAAANTPADAALQRAIQDLEGVFDRTAPGLPETAQAEIRASLSALDQAIEDAATQQRARPSDPRLARYLTSVLQRKYEVLQLVTQRTPLQT